MKFSTTRLEKVSLIHQNSTLFLVQQTQTTMNVVVEEVPLLNDVFLLKFGGVNHYGSHLLINYGGL